MKQTIRLGIGFATGRRIFKKVLLSHLSIWRDTQKDVPEDVEIRLSLFVSYDTNYQHTSASDFVNLNKEILEAFDKIVFIGPKGMSEKWHDLMARHDISINEIKTVFNNGYAGKRNAILYSAIENEMDYLLFLDDDEYPTAVTNKKGTCLWSGQKVILEHIRRIQGADYTNGYHCGYISPIPQIKYDGYLKEEEFKSFIEALSNDIISWRSIRDIMDNGGVTYASTEVLSQNTSESVPYKSGCRFISGANLCINLKNKKRTLPFYNPPAARGEDAFLSTMLKDRAVLRIPTYTFHDGFSSYPHILDGALPVNLKSIDPASPKTITRFAYACTGWIRYKPLFLYVTDKNNYAQRIVDVRHKLKTSIAPLANYFKDGRFLEIPKDFERYHQNVGKHFYEYLLVQETWEKIMDTL